MYNSKNITVAVAMSGGVDSSVAAALLVRKGFKVFGITMKTYDFFEVGGNVNGDTNCCDMKSVLTAREISEKLNIEHYVVNLRDEFNDIVIKNFIDEYLNGRTPNPCVLCNKAIKFNLLMKKAFEMGAHFFATGHYARLYKDAQTGRFVISRAKDKKKDQSYMLWAITQDALSKSVFPLGELTKEKVRNLAVEFNLQNARKQESFELCFIPDNDYERFLSEKVSGLKEKIQGGEIILDGKKVGTHKGYPFYTIGQRRDLGSYGRKMYVTKINPDTNTVYIGTDKDLYRRCLIAKDVNWIKIPKIISEIKGKAKIRYKDEAESASISMIEDNKIMVKFDEPKRAITPGQSVVVYDDEDILLGGVIEKVLD